MNGRERMEAMLRGDRPDRLPLHGVWGWGEAIQRWLHEGLSETDVSGWNVGKALGLSDPEGSLSIPLELGMVPRFPIDVLSKDEEHVVLKDEFGVTKRMLRSDYDRSGGYQTEAGLMSSMCEWLDYPVKDMASWKTLYEERFQPNLAARLPDNWPQARSTLAAAAQTHWVGFNSFPFFGLFGSLRELMGIENLSYAMADQPELIHTIVNDLATLWLAVFDELLGPNALPAIRLDQVMFFEDMCGTRAPLMGPAMYHTFLSPGYKKAIGGLREMGATLFSVDTDGNAWDIIPEMMAVGINGINPCEVRAGMDADRLRSAFPDLFLRGGIEKYAVAKGGEAMFAEVRGRFHTAWRKGRYIPSLDHGAAPDTSWANLKDYADLCRELASKPI